MPHITIPLIRKRAEHNEGLIHTLEEISLHQEELESISECLGSNCRHLKIVYLQNNVISKMENLIHMKQLEYLNLALNNIVKIEGLQSCEFLNKLDMTVNFVDLDELEASMLHLQDRLHLRELYMLGNPCVEWGGCTDFIIATLPQLQMLDGKEISRSMRIVADRKLPSLRTELRKQAKKVVERKKREEEEKELKRQERRRERREEKQKEKERLRSLRSGRRRRKAGGGGSSTDGDGEEVLTVEEYNTLMDEEDGAVADVDEEDDDWEDAADYKSTTDDDDDDDALDEEDDKIGDEEMTKHTPEARKAIYKEIAEQKKEKEDRQTEMAPKQRNYEAEQEEAVKRAKEREADGVVRQCNEGKWDFSFDEESEPGFVVLDVSLAKFLDSSLIDLDVHPTFVTLVIKSKVLRLVLPVEVKAEESKAQRSKTTGHLLVIMPKVDPKQSLGLSATAAAKRAPGGGKSRTTRKSPPGTGSTPGASSLSGLMMMEAAKAAEEAKAAAAGGGEGSTTPSQAVSIQNIVKAGDAGPDCTTNIPSAETLKGGRGLVQEVEKGSSSSSSSHMGNSSSPDTSRRREEAVSVTQTGTAAGGPTVREQPHSDGQGERGARCTGGPAAAAAAVGDTVAAVTTAEPAPSLSSGAAPEGTMEAHQEAAGVAVGDTAAALPASASTTSHGACPTALPEPPRVVLSGAVSPPPPPPVRQSVAAEQRGAVADATVGDTAAAEAAAAEAKTVVEAKAATESVGGRAVGGTAVQPASTDESPCTDYEELD